MPYHHVLLLQLLLLSLLLLHVFLLLILVAEVCPLTSFSFLFYHKESLPHYSYPDCRIVGCFSYCDLCQEQPWIEADGWFAVFLHSLSVFFSITIAFFLFVLSDWFLLASFHFSFLPASSTSHLPCFVSVADFPSFLWYLWIAPFSFLFVSFSFFLRFVYDPIAEYHRLGIPDSRWRLTAVNDHFQLCPTYLRIVVAPNDITDKDLKVIAAFRNIYFVALFFYILPWPMLLSFPISFFVIVLQHISPLTFVVFSHIQDLIHIWCWPLLHWFFLNYTSSMIQAIMPAAPWNILQLQPWFCLNHSPPVHLPLRVSLRESPFRFCFCYFVNIHSFWLSSTVSLLTRNKLCCHYSLCFSSSLSIDSFSDPAFH